MHIYTGIEQRSKEWFDLRAGRLTGTSIKTVLNGRPATKNKLLQEKWNEIDGAPMKPFFCSSDMQYGINFEPMARARYEFEYDTELFVPAFVVHGQHKFIGVSPDGMEYGSMAEIKCLKESVFHTNLATNEQAKIYYTQMQAQMWVCEKPECAFICFRHDYPDPSKRLHVVTIARDQDFINNMEVKCLEFNDHLQNRTFYEDVKLKKTSSVPQFF